MPKTVTVILIIAIVASACTVTHAQTQLQQQTDMQAAIKQLDTDIAAAEADAAKYQGGLIKALIESRIQTLKQTRAMLDQRAKSGEFGIGLRYTVDGRQFEPPADAAAQISAIEAESKKLQLEIAARETESSRYSGGVIHAMILSTIATSRNTLAMLEQRSLALKFGLPQFVGFASAPSQNVTPSGVSSAKPQAPQANPRDQFEIVDIDSRVTESNRTWLRFAWRLTIRNKDTVPHTFDATIEFQDSDGFVVDDDDESGLFVPPNSEQVFTGSDLIRASAASTVARTNAKVTMTR